MVTYVRFDYTKNHYHVTAENGENIRFLERDERWLEWLTKNKSFTYTTRDGARANFVKDTRGYWTISRRVESIRYQKRSGNDIALYLQPPAIWETIINDWSNGKVTRRFDYSQLQDWLLEIAENCDSEAIEEVVNEIADALDISLDIEPIE